MRAIKSYQFFADPAHGWLKVKRAECIALGIIQQISTCSYQRGGWVYLEEDCDAGLFLEAKKAKQGLSRDDLKIKYSSTYTKRSKIRSYDMFFEWEDNEPV